MLESKAIKNQKAQAILIKNTGYLVMLCSYYKLRNLRC